MIEVGTVSTERDETYDEMQLRLTKQRCEEEVTWTPEPPEAWKKSKIIKRPTIGAVVDKSKSLRDAVQLAAALVVFALVGARVLGVLS